MSDATSNTASEQFDDSGGGNRKINLADYRTTDLTERVAALLSIPEAFRKVCTSVLIVGMIAIVGCAVLRISTGISWLPLIGIGLYCMPASVFCGVLLGILRVMWRALSNIESVLQIVLDITRRVADDYGQLKAGQAQLPSGAELVEQVYDQVLLPVMESAVSSAFSLLGKPLLFVYRYTVGQAVRRLIKAVNRAKTTPETEDNVQQSAETALATGAKYSEKIAAYTKTASEFVNKVARPIWRYVMVPACLLYGLTVVMTSLPAVLIWHMTAPTDPVT